MPSPSSATLVIQSHRQPLPYGWLWPCMNSVKNWCELNGYAYQFIDDELLTLVPDDISKKFSKQTVILTDLARLLWLRQYLEKGYETVIWCDADFLIFKPAEFVLPEADYAVGREVWVQLDDKDKLRAYKKVHNAFMLFHRNNAFLNFYIETAERLLYLNAGNVPPQFIGPKLLTALHNISQFPVMESAGMFSPLVMKDLIRGHGDALALFKQKSPQPVNAANLSSSVAQQEGLTEKNMQDLISRLLDV